MAFIIKDRVKESTTSTGTGAVSLGGAASTFDTFQSFLTNGDTTYYAIVHTASGVDEWEVGLGTWNTGNTLTRTTVLSGSNGTSAVNFSAGVKEVFMTYPAAHAALAGDDVEFANITVTGTVDGRDVAADGTKLDTVETNADVTDAINVAAAGALMKSGGTMTGSLILSADPTTALGAATKEYVDTIAAAGIHYHAPVRVETPSALTATYNNGSSGVGATLTNSGTQAALSIDGVTLSADDRVLVYQQTNAAHNGIYTVTNTGSGSTNWVLTRATDADSYGISDPDAFGEGDAFFVKEGMTGAGELYVMNTSGTITFGTTGISFTVIAETAVYSAGTGITLMGTTFSIGQDVGTSSNVTFNQVTADIIGNVTGNVTGNITGNAGTATKLATARTVQLSGDVTGSASFDGSANINITATVQDDSHAHVISNVDGLQTALDGKTPTSRTITAGGGLTGGGNLTANRTISHADTSSQASLSALTGAAVVSDVDVDTYGHVTGLSTRNMTLSDLGYTGETNATADQTITAGGGLTGGGTGNVTLNHADTSAQGSVNNSGATVIQDVTLDTYGHVTGLASATLTPATIGAATSAQGALANSATQPGDNISTLTNDAGYTTNVGDITGVTAGAGITGGGTSGTVTINHADTSSQASVNNSGGTVIQDITLDTYGHLTGITSYNLDGRYYTESEANSRFVNVTGDTMTGEVSFNVASLWRVSASDQAAQRADARDDATTLSRLHWHGVNDAGRTSNFRHAWYDGSAYTNVTVTSGRIDFTGSASSMYIGNDRVFDDGYHPNADTLTTARTIGGVSFNGSANINLPGVNIAGNQNTTGNAATATNLSTDRTNWSTNGTISAVVGQLAWKNYNNNHTIFDASAGTSPSGTGKSNTNPDVTWASTYPTLMGWNGSSTYGVRVDISRYAEQLKTARTINGTSFNGTANITTANWGTARTITLGGDLSGSVSINGSTNVTLTATVADDSHNHTIANVDGLQTALDGKLSTSGKAADANLLDGLDLHTGRNNLANKVVRTQGNGYCEFGWINTTSGNTTSTLTDIYVNTNDGYIRKATPAHFRSQITDGVYYPASNPNGYTTYTANQAVNTTSNPTFNDLYIADQILHSGDTNTYMQFHAEDQWRVVTGGAERLEVNNSQITSTEPVHAPSFHGDGSNLTGIESGAKNDIFWENGQNVTTNYTITNGKNAMSAGPITINSGVTVTVGAGETWTVI